jgi:hypothetical protein
MKQLHTLLAIGSMLVLSAGVLQAQGAQVTCKDGSKSAGGQGACSGHGGISKSSVKADVKAATAATKADAKADVKVAKADAKAAKVEMKADSKVAAAKIDAKADKVAAKADAKMAKADAKASTMDTDPRGATAVCKDKSYSHSKTHQGACSSHGGVTKFLDGK